MIVAFDRPAARAASVTEYISSPMHDASESDREPDHDPLCMVGGTEDDDRRTLGECNQPPAASTSGGAKHPGSVGFGPHSGSQNRDCRQDRSRACHFAFSSGISPKLNPDLANRWRARAPSPWFFFPGFSSVPGSGTPLNEASVRRACRAARCRSLAWDTCSLAQRGRKRRAMR